MKLLTLFALFAGIALAQHSGAAVAQVQYPYDSPAMLFAYSGTNNTYIGYASAKQTAFSWTRAATTLTNIVVATNVGTATTSTAHGLAIGNPVVVTGSATTALNATYRIATVPSTTTFTITTSGVADATYTTGLVVTTTAPRSTAAIWAITCMTYDGSNNLTSKLWVNGTPGTFNQIWDNRATLACQ